MAQVQQIGSTLEAEEADKSYNWYYKQKRKGKNKELYNLCVQSNKSWYNQRKKGNKSWTRTCCLGLPQGPS